MGEEYLAAAIFVGITECCKNGLEYESQGEMGYFHKIGTTCF
jgi:hypothetical protein